MWGFFAIMTALTLHYLTSIKMFNDNNNLNWLRELLPYLTTIALSAWGGTVNYLASLRKTGQKFSFWRFVSEVVIASFAGVVTFFLCKHTSISDTMTAALVAISGHMGTRAIYGLENIYKRVFNFDAQTCKKTCNVSRETNKENDK